MADLSLFRHAPHILRQHIYALYSEQSEKPLELFLVPLGMEPAGGLYEAIFN